MKKIVVFNGKYFKEVSADSFEWAEKRQKSGYSTMFEGTLADYAAAKKWDFSEFEEVGFNLYKKRK